MFEDAGAVPLSYVFSCAVGRVLEAATVVTLLKAVRTTPGPSANFRTYALLLLENPIPGNFSPLLIGRYVASTLWLKHCRGAKTALALP